MTIWDLINHCRFSKKQAETFKKLLDQVNCEKLLMEYDKRGIKFLTIFDNDYPPLLKAIFDPPYVLYFQGNKQLLNHPNYLSVVGTRHPSEYIKPELEQILLPIIKKNIVIVSGLALGIDKMAHELSIAHGGSTIAVLAYGLYSIYPKSNEELFHMIRQNHLLLTEYPPYIRPQKWQFPERNRLISGLSKATFVVEATEKSGSLITGDLALQQNREVFALPGRISNKESKGTNLLIQEGAKMILHPNDIMEEYFLS
ncbi:DNA-processing protein DprA [Bacillus tamaricis]|uniref:DNA-processing protein DprA n=2 Tax=Evansella tamaricis TaxID=2069301 RepID=A0ABS6JLM8_9BACI|nr:DNA-processing protein DprA [Evansella tamaricis]